MGYVYTELGPKDTCPRTRASCSDELARRGLTVCGGTVFAGLHKGADALEKAKLEFGQEAKLLARGGRGVPRLPARAVHRPAHRRVHAGRDIDPEQWKNLVTRHRRAGEVLLEEHGVKLVFHPHADTHVDTQGAVERFLADTDPSWSTSAWTPGTSPTATATTSRSSGEFPERITYVHLKSVDPVVRARVLAEKLSFAEAVKLGVMCEPPDGEPDMPPLLEALGTLDREIFAVIEQDLYPCEPDIPLPIATRTRGYLNGCGLGPAPRRR